MSIVGFSTTGLYFWSSSRIAGEGIIWIGTWKGGLDRFDPKTEQFKYDIHDPNNQASLSYNEIQDIVENEFGNTWMATFGGGFNRFNRETGQSTRYQHDPDDLHSLSSNLVNSVYVTPSNVLWVGTNDDLSRFDSETEQFIRFPEFFKGQPVHKIYESKAKGLWVGATGGLSKFHPDTEPFSIYTTKTGLAS